MKALISVSNKMGIVDFSKYLQSIGVELISTGGTYDLLVKSGLMVTNISSITSFKNPIDTIIKTLYPEVYAGVSVNRNNKEQMEQISISNVSLIDFVIVNLYPIDLLLKDGDKNLIDEYLEYIDVGGPTLLRSAAKNYKDIVVISDPSDYQKIIKELSLTNEVSLHTRKYLMKKVFKTTAKYDLIISDYLEKNIK